MSCNNYHCANNITVNTGVSVVLAFSDSPEGVENTQKFCFRLCASIPSSGAALPVLVTVNGSNIPLLNKYGNPVLGNTLRKMYLYKGYFGDSSPHVIVHNLPSLC